MTTALEGGEGSASRPGRSLPPGKTRYPLYRRLGGPQGRSGQVGKISPPPGFDSRTVQPVASRYTDYTTRLDISLRLIILDSWYLKTGTIGCPETSARDCHYWLRNDPEECSSEVLRGGSQKSRIKPKYQHSFLDNQITSRVCNYSQVLLQLNVPGCR